MRVAFLRLTHVKSAQNAGAKSLRSKILRVSSLSIINLINLDFKIF